MLRNILVFLVLAAVGYILVKLKIIKEKDTLPLSTILIKVSLPAIVFANTLSMELTANNAISYVIMGAVSLLYIILMAVVSKPLLKKIGDEKAQKTARYSFVFSNVAFLGLPLAKAVFGDSVIIDYLLVQVIIGVIALNTLGIYLFAQDKSLISVKKIALNSAVLAFIAALILNATNVCAYVPEIKTVATHLANIATPISMIIIGIKFAQIKPQEVFTSKKMWYVAFLKLIVQPLIITAIFLIANIFIEIPSELIIALFIAFAAPTAGTVVSFADAYDSDVDGAVKYSMGITILSAISISALYAVLCLFI